MGIKDDLEAEQRRLFSEFVSVRTLIESLADDQECSTAEVATFLLNKIETIGRDAFPELLSIDLVRLRVVREVCAEPLMPLWDIASGDSIEGDLNDCGWKRSEISEFILRAGVSVVPHLPAWKPRGSSPSVSDNRIVDQGNEYEWLDHPLFPNELSIAITAWNAAVTNSEQSGKRPAEFIRGWLKENNPELKTEAVNRIATVANWDKVGGRSKKIG